MSGFRIVYTDDPLPTGGDVFIYNNGTDMVMVVHEPALWDDPRGVSDARAEHLDANVMGHVLGLARAG